MPVEMPEVADLLRKPTFGGRGAPPPVARPAAMAPARPAAFQGAPAAAPPAAAPAAPPAGLAATLAALAGLGTPPSAAPPPASPTRPGASAPPIARPARPLRALTKDLIRKALANNEERLLWFSKADLDLLGFDEAALDKLLDSLDLFAADNIAGGGTLIARSQEILKERLQPQPGEGIPVYGVIQHARQEGRI
jgi:hypothetical protein